MLDRLCLVGVRCYTTVESGIVMLCMKVVLWGEDLGIGVMLLPEVVIRWGQTGHCSKLAHNLFTFPGVRGATKYPIISGGGTSLDSI